MGMDIVKREEQLALAARLRSIMRLGIPRAHTHSRSVVQEVILALEAEETKEANHVPSDTEARSE